MRPTALALLAALGLRCHGAMGATDWPALRGDGAHTGCVAGELRPPFRLVWVREINGERLGTAMEAIVSGGKVFLATHAGNVYALASDSGDPRWRFQAGGPFLQSPTVSDGRLLAASADGRLYGLNVDTGELAWQVQASGGFSASPTTADGVAYIGTRGGEFLALSVSDGAVRWRRATGAPFRQTAAVLGGRVFVTAEDMRARCFAARDGQLIWTSEPLPGQSARDYYPVVVSTRARTWVVLRTNPTLEMADRLGRDRSFLCRNAGVQDSSWQGLEAWMKSAVAHGTPRLWTAEQMAIRNYLTTNQEARTCFVLDAETGNETIVPPVLWIGGCQGVGTPPALTSEGQLLVYYRSAYGNWNLGVSGLVALGLLDLGENRITPLFHPQGAQPAWNCFWGTADESQNFTVVGDTVLIIHQGTLSGFNLKRNELFPIWGERDTYGGLANPPWARNEWHGPARSGVAIAGNRLYWQTGSRVLCLAAGGAPGSPARPQPVPVGDRAPSAKADPISAPTKAELRARLAAVTRELLSQTWTPLYSCPGWSGRTFSFDHSGELFEALAWAFPHLPADLQGEAKARLLAEWREHPPVTRQAWYSLREGSPRESFRVPAECRVRLGSDRLPSAFGNLHAAWWFARRCAAEKLVLDDWPGIKAAFHEFTHTGWRLDAVKGDRFANRYLASLLAFEKLASRAGDQASAEAAGRMREETVQTLADWWRGCAGGPGLGSFKGSGELDAFIGQGGSFSLAVAPHRHVVALFQDLTPEVARIIQARAPEAALAVWRDFSRICPTWALTGEERQIHSGENFIDPPDFSLAAFRACAWLNHAPASELARAVDIPCGRADCYYLIKLAVALEAE